MRLLTYNIHKGIGGRDHRYSLDRIIEVIEDQNPDVICLQEVDRNVRRSRFDNQPRLLADHFHAAGKLFQFNVKLKSGGYGNLLLTRWPILRHHQISLRYKWKKRRGAQTAVLDTPEGELHVVNWHLGLSEKERHWQVQHLLGHRLFRGESELPTLIAGDTNDWRDTLKDGSFHKDGFEHVTHPVSRFRSFPAYMAVGSLDKAFLRGQIAVKHAHVIRSAGTKIASDHLPLVVDFHLE